MRLRRQVFPYIALLSRTLQLAAYEVLCFLVLFFIVFIGCGQAFMMTCVAPHAPHTDTDTYTRTQSAMRKDMFI